MKELITKYIFDNDILEKKVNGETVEFVMSIN